MLERGLEKRLDAIEDTNKSILKVIYNLVRQEACSSPKNTRDHVPISRSQITLPLEKRVDLVSAKCYGRHQEPKMSSGSLGRASLAYLKNIETIVIPKDEDAHDLKKCSTFFRGEFMRDHKKRVVKPPTPFNLWEPCDNNTTSDEFCKDGPFMTNYNRGVNFKVSNIWNIK